MWWTSTLRTSAEDLGTLAENEPPTGHEPDHFITEAYVEYTQESKSDALPLPQKLQICTLGDLRAIRRP